MTACYLSIAQTLEVGPFTFTAIRLLVAVGVLRVVLRGERLVGGIQRLDTVMMAWGLWLVLSGLFHIDPIGTFNTRLGQAYNSLGIYFLLRIFCTSIDDVVGLGRATVILLIPVALEMVYEMRGSASLFHAMQGSMPINIRENRVRAVGPFLHSILAGTVGAICLPLVLGMWRQRRVTAIIGAAACLTIVFCSASSGPIFSTFAGLLALSMWRFRYEMRTVRWMIVAAYFALAVAMNRPVYYVIAGLDVVSGSTGYHRALLIDSAVKNWSEWWLIGTDYTAHWAPSTGPTPEHTDMTNQYVQMGVLGGLPLMILFFVMLVRAFSMVGERLRDTTGISPQQHLILWGLGSSLLAHVVTIVSVTYFDQSFVFFYLTLGAIGSAHGVAAAVGALKPQPTTKMTSVGTWRSPARSREKPQAVRGARRLPSWN